jgi:DNA-binding MarR family transcriptional regulator
MARRDQGYLRVPRGLVSDRSVKSSDVRVFAVLMDMRTPADLVADGLDAITKHTGLTKRTVCDCLARLEERGFITRESRRGPYTGLITISDPVGYSA